jgi:O-antigen ligase
MIRKIAFLFVLGLIFSVPWQNVIVIEALGTISRLLGFAAIGVAILVILIYRRIQEPSLLILVMLIFVIWSFATYFWSVRPAATIGRVVTLVQLVSMVWLLWEFCNNYQDFVKILQTYVFGCMVAVVDMLVTFSTNTGSSFRIAATGFNPNWLAITLATGIPIAWYLVYSDTSKYLRWINLISIPLIVFAIILTASRGGFVAMLVGLAVIPLTLFYLERRIQRVVIISGIVIIMTLIFYLPQIYPRIEQNIDRLMGTQTAITEGSLNYREVIWRAGWQVFKQHPITGVGARGFSETVSGHLVSGRNFAAHNAYLSVLVDTGIIGLILFLSMLTFAIAHNLSLSAPDRSVFIILVLTITVGMIPANMEANKTIWCILGILSAYRGFVIRNGKILLVQKE